MINEQKKVAVDVVIAIAEIIRNRKAISSGELYAHACATLDIDGYKAIVQCLKNARLVVERQHMLTWVGPRMAQ